MATNVDPDALLRGVKSISEFLGLPETTTKHLLYQGRLPASKMGRCWVTTPARLRQVYAVERREVAA